MNSEPAAYSLELRRSAMGQLGPPRTRPRVRSLPVRPRRGYPNGATRKPTGPLRAGDQAATNSSMPHVAACCA